MQYCCYNAVLKRGNIALCDMAATYNIATRNVQNGIRYFIIVMAKQQYGNTEEQNSRYDQWQNYYMTKEKSKMAYGISNLE